MEESPNLWLWLGPYGILLLIMLYAMVEFTVSLFIKYPPPNRRPVTAAQLRARLLALCAKLPPFDRVESPDSDLELRWQAVAKGEGRFWKAKRQTTVRVRLLFDEERHEVRANESSHSSGYIIGLDRWLPRLSGGAGYSAGPLVTGRFAERIAATANAGGWTYRPVVLPFQVTRRGLQFLQALTPTPFRQLPPTQVWGILYPLTYVLAFVWLFGRGSPALWTTHNLWLFVLISTVWWGVWGLLVWTLHGFPKFWR